ncbi:hypothetical protein OAA06_02050 [bacterium]|nr:hypothetical protein [bacterium]
MKFIYITLISIIFFGASHNYVLANGKEHLPDTIYIKLPNGITIQEIGSFANTNQIPDAESLSETVDYFLLKWEVLQITTSPSERLHIVYAKVKNKQNNTVHQEIEIKERNNEGKIIFPTSTNIALYTQGRHMLELVGFNRTTKIYFDTIHQLEQLKFRYTHAGYKSLKENIDQPTNGISLKQSINTWFDIDDNSLASIAYHNTSKQKYTDQIDVLFGAGIERAYDFVVDFSVNLGLTLGKKQAQKNSYSLQYDLKSNFDDYYHFISLCYLHNFSKVPHKDRWFGLNIGGNLGSDYFGSGDMYFGLKYKINNRISVEPNMYLVRFFDGVQPSLKIGIALY